MEYLPTGKHLLSPVSCGPHFSAFLDNNGGTWVLYKDRNAYNPIPFKYDSQLFNVFCCSDNIYLLDCDGNVFHTDLHFIGSSPPILDINNIVFRDCCYITSSFTHVIFLDLSGKIYGFGSNYCGQLGKGQNYQFSLKEINIPEEFPKIKSIISGNHSTFFLTEEGVWAIGDNEKGIIDPNSEKKCID